MAGLRITQLSPSAVSGRRYGLFDHAAVSPVVETERGGVWVLQARVVGRARWIAPLPRVTAHGVVRAIGRGRLVAALGDVQGRGLMRLRGAAALAASPWSMYGGGAVANPGEWVIVVDADEAEDVTVVVG